MPPAFEMMRGALAVGGTVVIKDFDTSMARFSHFDAFELVTLEELRHAFEGLEVVRAEIVDTPAHVQSEDGDWTAALFVAKRR